MSHTHREPGAALDGSMVLLDDVVEVFALTQRKKDRRAEWAWLYPTAVRFRLFATQPFRATRIMDLLSSGNHNLDVRSHTRQFRPPWWEWARFLEGLGVNGIHTWEQVYIR
jgi:hypothetical protein